MSVSTDLMTQVQLNWSDDPDSNLTNPIWKDGVQSCSTHLNIFIVISLLDGWATKVKDAPSYHELGLTLLDKNSVFLSLSLILKLPVMCH